MRRLILLYNSFFGTYPDFAGFDCIPPDVEFTIDRSRLREADAVVFHLPWPREIHDAIKYPGQLWIGWSMESRMHTGVWNDTKVMTHFDLRMGFDRNYDVWSPYLPPLEAWAEVVRRPLEAKTEPNPMVLIQSTDSDRSGRDAFAIELMQHLAVDSYGRFQNNRSMPVPDQGIATKLQLISRYRFCLALENTIEGDYVTEKFFQPLQIGTVPVYRGAPNIEDFAPGDHCYIDASKYDSPRELARHLTALAADEAEYARYHEWRSRPFRPGFLKLLEDSRVEPFCRLALLVKNRLEGRTRATGRAVLPFGWRGYIRTKLYRMRRAHTEARRRRSVG